jgi:hypothetical protein
MKTSFVRLRETVLSRMGESSTWQGIGFLAVLLGARWAQGLDWGAAAALGGTVSALIKSVLPDNLEDK